MRQIPPPPLPLLVKAVARLPFALFWGPGCVIRRTAESFIWDAPPAWAGRRDDPRGCGETRHIYNIVCEPPCYRCGSCQGCWHG